MDWETKTRSAEVHGANLTRYACEGYAQAQSVLCDGKVAWVTKVVRQFFFSPISQRDRTSKVDKCLKALKQSFNAFNVSLPGGATEEVGLLTYAQFLDDGTVAADLYFG